MRSADRISGVLLLIFGAGFAAGARQYPYWTPTGPGSGFLPLWLGVVMAALAIALFVGAMRRPDPGEAWLPEGRGLVRLIVVVVATIAFVWLLPFLGMTLATFLFLVGILRFLERHSWFATVGVALATSAANWLVFIHWLNVPFPTGILGF
jgi:putative tricarboxylic transport membrane protein